MKVKRFVANDIQEAIAKVKRDMGNDAVILHTRHFKEGGILGMFKKSYIEITAALENSKPEIIRGFNIPQINKNVPVYIPAANSNQVADIVDSDIGPKNNIEKLKIEEKQNPLEAKAEDLKFCRLGQNLYEHLKKQGIEEKIALRTVRASLQQNKTDSVQTQEETKEALLNNLLKPIKNKHKPLSCHKHKSGRSAVYAVVGPTGVGKTTTIAKMAAMYAFNEGKKVSFITVDTYRIAAAEQLKTIGDIMNVPVSVVYSLSQLEYSLKEMSDQDIIFIDTAGRSHKNNQQIEELKKYLEIAGPDEIFLALPCTGKYEDMLNILEAYKEMEPTRLIFTKLDETSFYGSIYNIICQTKYPLAYFTTGQSIPDDIETADPAKLVQLLVKEQLR